MIARTKSLYSRLRWRGLLLIAVVAFVSVGGARVFAPDGDARQRRAGR